MRIDFLDSADAEFTEVIAYYNLQSEGLGYEFAAEIKRAVERILQYPKAWTPLSVRTRRCRVNRFPHALIYQIRSDSILIVAVQNLHQHPSSWKSRLQPGQR